MDIKSRLSQVDSQLGKAKKASKRSASARPAPSERIAKLQRALGGEIICESSGEFLLIRQYHDANYSHGQIKLADSLQRADYCVSHINRDCQPQRLAKKNMLFFDTETTGLGGAGAVPFLIGVGSFVRGGFETRQYIIPDFPDEAAMLERVLAEFSSDTVVVSYNGRAFDAPLTTDRLIVNRIARELPFAHHLDLLYTARSLYKRRIQDCSLGNVEARIFGYERGDDIPGYLVPGVFLNWAHEDDTGELPEVIAHNRQDIVSLAMLLALFAEAHVSSGDALTEPLDVYSFMRRAEARKERALAADLSRRRGAEMADVGAPEIEFHRSLALKRDGDLELAVPIWKKLESGRDRFAQLARLELAKWSEHSARDYKLALRLTQKAQRFSLNRERELNQWRNREARLKRRLSID